MDDRSDGRLDGRLDLLEHKGRGALAAAARHDARVAAMRIAARAAIVAPLAALLLGAMRPVGALGVLVFAVVVPLAVFAAIYAARLARFHVGRGAALALIDQTLGLKDRAVTTAEFAQGATIDGFRLAAMQEAQPWLDRAAAAPLAPPAGAAHGRDGPWLAAAAVLLIAALAVRQPLVADRPGEASPALRRIAAAFGVHASDSGTTGEPADRGGRPASAGRQAGAVAGGGTGAASDRPPGQGDDTGAGGGTAAGATAPPGTPGEGGGAAPSAGGPAGASDLGGGTGRSPAAALRSGAPDQVQRDAAAERQGALAPADGRATPPAGSPGAGAAAPAPMAGTPPASRDSGSNDRQQRSGSRNRQQSGQQSGGPGQANNNSAQQGSNRGNGQEGIKRAHGTTGLMLAVPMEDRVIGTINAGRVSSTTRPAPPRPMRAGIVAAQPGVAGQPQAGRIVHRPRTAQEDRLLETYFRRPGVGQ